MTLTTLSAATHITPVVVRTFFKHYKIRGLKLVRGDAGEAATDDIFFDEGFNIVKAFIELGTYNTVESLQAFTNTHVPAPPWAAVAPITIPIPTCNAAADVLIDWFGPDDLKYVVGGQKWWQVRGLDGIDAEWITEREFLADLNGEKAPGRKNRWEEDTVLRMEHLETVMLYVHGGAYFWGSINSHRYQMIRYARKFQGRLFAVNYRKAPQYPWPCPLHDVIAAYLYLTRPPPDAPHKAVPPEKIVVAGDSAGAGICVALLTVLRDLGMPQPAGAVLISPWVDLTHSFPSVMVNTSSDIIPPHGFIHKPSPTWPIHDQMSYTVAATETNPPPIPGHADETKPSPKRAHVAAAVPQEPLPQDEVPSQASMLMLTDIIGSSDWVDDVNAEIGEIQVEPRSPTETSSDLTHFFEEHEPKPPKVLMDNPHDVPLELQAQIQIYATNEQLTHPLVSPLLQASLGNLCPLYIIAGDGEVLVDEIVYLAHKAAYPASFPLRQGVMGGSQRQQDNAKKFTTPTNVHLQVFDGMPHVLTVFGYTESAKYAYRSVAQFVKHVTQQTTYLGNFPFPELCEAVGFEREANDSDSELDKIMKKKQKSKSGPSWFGKRSKGKSSKEPVDEKGNEDRTVPAVASSALSSHDNVTTAGGVDTEIEESDRGEGTSTSFFPQRGSPVIMLRERVDIHGKIRPMEPMQEMPALRIPPSEIGLIKEAPVRRWLQGQRTWDERFKRRSKKILEKRKNLEKKAVAIVRHATGQGLVVNTDGTEERAPDEARPTMEPQEGRRSRHSVLTIPGTIDESRRYGPLDLYDENPPPSAIAGRRDTPEALALLRKCIYHTAPVTHSTVPKRKTMEVIKATFDPSDHPVKPPPQSVSEQQVKANIIPVHGLRMWDLLVGYMGRKKAKQRAKIANAVGNGVSGMADAVSGMAGGGRTTPASPRDASEGREKRT